MINSLLSLPLLAATLTAQTSTTTSSGTYNYFRIQGGETISWTRPCSEIHVDNDYSSNHLVHSLRSECEGGGVRGRTSKYRLIGNAVWRGTLEVGRFWETGFDLSLKSGAVENKTTFRGRILADGALAYDFLTVEWWNFDDYHIAHLKTDMSLEPGQSVQTQASWGGEWGGAGLHEFDDGKKDGEEACAGIRVRALEYARWLIVSYELHCSEEAYSWTESPMEMIGNELWRGGMQVGRYSDQEIFFQMTEGVTAVSAALLLELKKVSENSATLELKRQFTGNDVLHTYTATVERNLR